MVEGPGGMEANSLKGLFMDIFCERRRDTHINSALISTVSKEDTAICYVVIIKSETVSAAA